MATRSRTTRSSRSRVKTEKQDKAPRRAQDSVVVYVHGVGKSAVTADYKPSAAEIKRLAADLKLQWDLATFGRDLGKRSHMAYWADLLPLSPQGTSASLDDGGSQSFSGGIDAILRRASIGSNNPDARRFVAAMMAALGVLDDQVESESVATPGAIPGQTRSKANLAFIRDFVAAAAGYFYGEGKPEDVQRRLQDALKLTSKQHVTIVAHGFGSIAAYEALSLLKPRNTIDALVTLGSPLGLEEVRSRLHPRPAKVPIAIKRWRNFAHPLDVVAADKRLTNNFDPRGAIEDELVMSTATGKTWEFDPHSAIAYLSHPSVRAAISDDMRMDVMGHSSLRAMLSSASTRPRKSGIPC